MKSRERLPNEPPLLDAERAIRLAEDATALFHARVEVDDRRRDLAVQLAMDAAHLALETAIDTGDPRVLDAALELAGQREVCWGEEHFEREIASAAGVILPAVSAIDNLVRSAARSKSSFLRLYTARGLGPRALRSLRGESAEAEAEVDAEAAGIVLALTKDADADVRAAAREALGGAAPPAWATFYPRDPLASRPAAEAARLRGPLDRAAEALEEGVRDDAGPLADAIAELPDELATPILDAWIRTALALHAEDVTPLLERWIDLDPSGERTAAWLLGMRGDGLDLEVWLAPLLERPGGGAVLARLIVLWDSRGRAAFTSRPLHAAGKRLTETARARAFGELLDALREQEIAAREGGRYLRDYLVEHAVAIMPEQPDARQILEAILGVSVDAAAAVPGEQDHATSKLASRLASCPLDDALRAALIEARRAGMPGRWERVGREVWTALGPDPVLRERAWRDLDDPRAEVREEAVGALLGAHHDPVDGAVDELARRLYQRPELRAAVLRRRGELLAQAREDLLRGELDLDAATVVLGRTPRAEETDAMWVVARAVRDRAVDDPTRSDWASPGCFFALVRELEEGPDPRDLPYIRAVVERALAVEGESTMLRFASEKLARMPGEESAALEREIDARATTEELRRQVRAGREYARPA